MGERDHLVVGTAGHVDHGKSALVLALTGVDPDRLPEEKRRGITIDLGFAELRFENGRAVSFVDVPGHERFVRHMIAGAAGIDAVMLVVAADRGVEPQTREHLTICSLLDVRAGIVAITKSDLVDAEMVEVVRLEVLDLVLGTFLDGAPVLPVSVRKGAGLTEVRQALLRLFDGPTRDPERGVARLPIDRSFALKGLGTVVTGTLGAGRLAEGDEIEILPGGQRGRIRGLEVHNRRRTEVAGGQRAAINLQGLDRRQAPRGATLALPGSLSTTKQIWARLEPLARTRAMLPKGGTVRFHHGTAEIGARVRVLRSPGDPEWVEIRFATAVAVAPGDRFVLRRPAPVDTLGGGVVVDAHPPRWSPSCAEVFRADALDLRTAVDLRLSRAGPVGVESAVLGAELGVSAASVEAALLGLHGADRAERASARWYSADIWREMGRKVREALESFHRERPLESGPSREALRGQIGPALAQEAWRQLLQALADRGVVRLLGDRVALAEHEIVLGADEQQLAETWCGRVRMAALEPLDVGAVSSGVDAARDAAILELLIARRELVRLPDRRLVHAESLAQLREALREHARESRTIDIGGFKRLAGVTRKNAIALLELLDSERSTRRSGDVREILLAPAPPPDS